MRVWIPPRAPVQPVIPDRVETVFVLSRVTLGADIKITSIVLNAMKRRFPEAEIVLVGNRKSAELFSADSRISHLNADYPRTGPVPTRIQFAHDLRRQIDGPNRLVVDPDSRMTQLGLIPVCAPEHYFHFPSRGREERRSSLNLVLTELTQDWLLETFGESGEAYIATPRVAIEGDAPRATVSLGVGDNETKRVHGDFEAQLIRALGEKFRTIWIDRGVGGNESARVTAAARGFRLHRSHPLLGRLVRRLRFAHLAVRSLRRLRFRRTARRRRDRHAADNDLRGRTIRTLSAALVPARPRAHPHHRRRFAHHRRVHTTISRRTDGFRPRGVGFRTL